MVKIICSDISLSKFKVKYMKRKIILKYFKTSEHNLSWTWTALRLYFKHRYTK